MPLYEYNAALGSGKKIKGSRQAESPASLRTELRQEGVFLLECRVKESKVAGKKLKAKELSEFCRELGMMIESGVPLVRAVSIMVQRDIKPHVKKVYETLYRDLQKGLMLSDAMIEQKEVFPELLINMIKSSESTGGMDKTCLKMAEHYSKIYKVSQKAKSAMTYPIILACVTFVVVIVIFLAVLPKFFEVFEDLNAELPAITSFMLNVSQGLKNHWMAALIIMLVIILAIKTAMKVPDLKRAFDKLKLKAPIFGKLNKAIYTSRFARTLSSSYSSGVSIINALENTRDTIGNSYISGQFDEMIKKVREGEALSAAVAEMDGMDPKLAASILIGEETGRLDQMLESMADTFDYEADMATQRMTTMMEPLMIIIMAGVIGIIIVSVILPLPALYNSLGQGL